MTEEDKAAAAEKEKAAAGAKAGKAKPVPEAAAEPRQVLPIAENRWQLKEYQDPGGWLCVPHGTTIEDVLTPAFWAHIAKKLRPSTTVQVHWDDQARFAEVYVLAAGRNWASVCVLRDVKLEKPHLPESANRYGISFNGPVDKFRITRTPDNAVIQAGFVSEADAQRWLREYLQKLAA